MHRGLTIASCVATCSLDPEVSSLDVSPGDLPEGTIRQTMSWRRIVARTFRASTTDRVSLAAAGCAFYATLALFPAISMLISIYGMAFDPVSAEQQLAVLS